MPESLLRIHFPKSESTTTAKPWFWWFNRQQPMSFVYLAPPKWGVGWMRLPIRPVIKILQIDTQPEIPLDPYGFTSLIDAIKNGDPDAEWGRFNFTNDLFWELVKGNDVQNTGMPKTKPLFNMSKGLVKARDSKTNIKAIIEKAARQFEADWSGDAGDYNLNAASNLLNPTDPNAAAGFHYSHVHGRFAVEQPDGPTASFAGLSQQLGAFHLPLPLDPNARFLSALPLSACFNFNTITTAAYAYTINVGQLDDRVWNMSVFPPIDATIIGNGTASAKSGDYSGQGVSSFPLFNPSP
jgi:hypothetical protein